MKDSRLGQIRRLATEAADIARELRDELDDDAPEDYSLVMVQYYLQ
ncbi:hypothetical protein PP713_13890 [Mycobacterium sp. CSUR Q5927]|nr:hypothetical protein [Mycobacterium sp. CSUR Q5927]